jgi:antirestriction protein ArdC
VNAGATPSVDASADANSSGSGARFGRDDLLARLQAGIARLTSSAEWLTWLAAQAKFWRYSPSNCMLIASQRGDVSAVAGFHRWLELGRYVRKGETGIRILVPCRYRTTVESDDGDDVVVERVRSFRVGVVFGLEQTDGAPLPQMPIARIVGEDSTNRFRTLSDFARSLGYEVTTADFASLHKCGETNFTTHRITLRHDLAPAHRCKTMLHELGHIVGKHDSCSFGGRTVAELEAESIAWICCAAIGIVADSYSFAYCSSWSGGGDEAIAQIKASAQRIQAAARTILDGLGVTPRGTL